jgi:HEAT repeat protein
MPRRIIVAAALAACLAADLAPIWATEPSPLDVFHRYYREKSPQLRLKAVSQLEGLRGAGIVEALFQAVTDADREVRERAAGILAEPRDAADEIAAVVRIGLGKQPPEVRVQAAHALALAGSKAVRELRSALGDRQPEVQRVAALSLAGIGDRESAPLLSELLTSREALVRAAAIEGLGTLLGDDAVGPASAVVLGDRAPEPRIAAAEILGRYPRPQTAEHLARGLADGSWSMRVAASRALGGFRVDTDSARAAAGPLVRALGDEARARVRVEMAEALFALTGIDFGPEPDRWRAWYGEAGATFEPPVRRPQRGAANSRATQGHLLDLSLESEHVSFVLDFSHSMTDPIRFGVEATKRAELQRSLEVVFGKLGGGAYVNLIPFGSEPHPYKPALFSATPAAKQAALRFLEKMAPDGRTNIYDSLEIALADPDADTLVLVTDGAPTEGKRRTRSAILAGVRQLNRYRLARIHAVEVGAQNTSPRWKGFMKEIADATSGSYLSR